MTNFYRNWHLSLFGNKPSCAALSYFEEKDVKKLFLVFLVLLVGMSGLSAAPPGEGGAGDTSQVIIPQADISAFIAAPGVQAPMLLDVDLICLWADQYRQGLLTQGEFKTLVVGRIDILKTDTNGMNSLVEKTRQKVNYLLMHREVELGIRGPTSLAPGGFPLLC
jgi:hypothetical protein